MGFALTSSAFIVFLATMIWIAVVVFGRFDNWISRLLKRSPQLPPKLVTIDVPHCLGKAEARRRLYVVDRNLANQRVLNRRSIVVKWEEDRAYFANGGVTGYYQFGEDCLQIHAAIPDSFFDTAEAMAESIKRAAESMVSAPKYVQK